MNTTIKNYAGVLVVVALAAFVVAVLWFASAFSGSVGSDRTFSVSAEGEVIAVPDIAIFTFSVLTQGGENISSLQSSNAEKVNKANQFLKDNGVEEEDIRTISYNISPRYQYFGCEQGPCPPPEIVGYTINQSVEVTVRDLTTAGKLVAGVVREGANTSSNLTFTIDDPTEIRNEARDKAINMARDKAKAIAKSAGFRVGDLVSINESTISPSAYTVFAQSARGVEGDSITPDFEPGSEEVKVTVTLTYEIK